MEIRRERPGDEPQIYQVHAAAFGRPGASKDHPAAPLVDELRQCDDWVPALSLVAVTGDLIVGHVACSHGHLVPSGDALLYLGPLGVRPEHQQQGVGRALMHAVLGAANARDEPVVVLRGDPEYYHRFRFVPALSVGIEPPEESWGDRFQARCLSAFRPGRLTGTFVEPEPHDRLQQRLNP